MTFANKILFVFDLDGTLAETKTTIQPEMCNALIDLLHSREQIKIAIISGCAWHQFQTQFLESMEDTVRSRMLVDLRTNIFRDMVLLPTCGAQMYVASQDLKYERVYHNNLSLEEKIKIFNAWFEATKNVDIDLNAPYGDIIEDRESQITFSLRGQKAPLEIKKTWDPDFQKRKRFTDIMAPMLPNFEVRMGGSTSIDVTRTGIDKAFGINKLMETFQLEKKDIVFVGDALFEGGNDWPAKNMGIDCFETTGPTETLRLIELFRRK